MMKYTYVVLVNRILPNPARKILIFYDYQIQKKNTKISK